ncbi:metallophosphoesterase family protein [Sinomonas sp. JGH33]|uniref:Metallophosphoesterase family protein n=1 Tax=Sinomonas terricola TaxID=3110330 RepID=A0ABU5T0K9_9MICC|nr:metallophosphoesterase family protein [Sinomonas sp. JGH33]MEA5453125.1 metallophosphoesterase family protein [Sinomonas sp. JGH33]
MIPAQPVGPESRPVRRRPFRVAAGTAAALLSVGAAVVGLSSPALAEPQAAGQPDAAFRFAVIGDTPYGAAAIQEFPQHFSALNADASLDFVVHVGDIKNGSTVCSDEYFAQIKADFDQFTHPLVYAPGDNEWTDCHRANNGAYNPLERLAKIREVFFAAPGKTLGATMPVASQADLGLPENVTFSRNRIAFAAVNVPGSNNSMLPWTGLGKTAPTPEQTAEVQHRTDAVIAELRQTFAEARQRHDRTVVVLQQADMFDPTYAVPWSDISAFKPIVQTLVDEASAFDGDVYLFDGDSHVYNADRPLAAASPWLAKYGVAGHADNLQRITVDGAAKATDYLRVSVAPNGAAGAGKPVLSWENIPFAK